MSAPSREIVPAWDHAPAVGPRHVVRREHFGALVYDRETCQYVPYDAAAAALLLSPRAPRDEAEAAFLEAAREDGLLTGDAADLRLTARVVADRAAPGRLSAPLTVYLGATQGCNLACGTCSSGSGPGPLGALDADVIRRLLRELFDLGCMLVHVTGGEPLMHPALLPALDEGFALGLNVMLTTNGTLLTEALADALAARPFRTINVSLDGADAGSHELVRGPGAFQRALAGLRLLAARRPVGVTTTYTPALRGRLPDLVRLCEEAGAASLSLRPALPAGRALARPDLVPSQADFLAGCRELDALQERAAIPLFHPPEVPHEHTSAGVLERFGCVAGNLVCSVTPAGAVSPCALLGPTFDAGSLRAQTLHELWATSAPFVRLRALEGNRSCWTCRHYDHCGGGCRARALAATGDLDAPDPWCRWEPAADPALVLP